MLPKDYPHSTNYKAQPTRFANNTTAYIHQLQQPSTPHGTLHRLMGKIHTLVQNYSDVYDTSKGLRPMLGPPMALNFRDDIDIIPFRARRARAVPLHQQDEADAEVQRLVEGGVLKRATATGKWLLYGFFVAKPDRTLRLVFDCRPLNKYLLRPTHPFYHTDDILHMIPPDTRFLISLDCRKGYWQIALTEEAQETLTMLLHSGCYSWTRAPMGCSASSDEWCRRSDEAFRGIPHVLKIVDDLLVVAPDEQTAVSTVHKILERCRIHHITLSKKKMQIGRSAKFVGHIIEASDTGVKIKPDPDRVASLAEFPTPCKLQDLRSFLGLAQQFNRFNPDLAHIRAPLLELQKMGTPWNWLPEHQTAFDNIKQALTSPAVLHPFDPALETELYCDAARLRGMGFCLVQKSPDEPERLRLIECGSINLTPAQENYAVTELEANAIIFGITKCWYHLLGCRHFKVVTDHAALIPIFNKKNMHDVPNTRLQRLMEKVADYSFTVEWCKGSLMKISDCFSRYPVFKAKDDYNDVDHMHKARCNHLHTSPAIDELSTMAAQDLNYQMTIRAWREGKSIGQLPHDHPARLYKKIWDEIGLEENLLTRGQRIIIPKSAQNHILHLLHLPHKGIPATKASAKQKYWWPTMKTDIERICHSCPRCQELLPRQQQEPLLPTTAKYPFHHVSCDKFDLYKKDFVALMDRYSGFLFVGHLTALNTSAMIKFVTRVCTVPGYPTIMRTDRGPQFRAEFKEWCRKHNIDHDYSDPLAPWTNGHGESGVACAKRLLKKNGGKYNEDFLDQLIEWNATPRPDGFSPAAMLNGRVTRSMLPALEQTYGQPIDHYMAAAARAKTAASAKRYYDSHAKPLPPLHIDQKVVIYDEVKNTWSIPGTVVAIDKDRHDRSIQIDIGGGVMRRRNRRHVRPDKTQHSSDDEQHPLTQQPSPQGPHTPNSSPQIIRRSTRIAAKAKNANL